jgi:hypothetical protein
MSDPLAPHPGTTDGADIPPRLPRCLAVRSRTEQLHVVALWQVLGRYAPHVMRTRVIMNRKMAVEELSLTFTAIPDEALVDIVSRLSALPWVLDAWFSPMTDGGLHAHGRPR